MKTTIPITAPDGLPDYAALIAAAQQAADLRPLVRAIFEALPRDQAQALALEMAAESYPLPDEPISPVLDASEFEGQTTVIAKNQPQYRPLPARYDDRIDDQPGGFVTFCWKLTPAQLAIVNRTGQIWHRVMLCYGQLQPVSLFVTRPFEVKPPTES